MLFDRLRFLFDEHTPEASPHDAALTASRKPLDSQTLPGPRWKLPTFGRFMHTLQAMGPTALSRAEADQLFQAICGKGGSMDLIDFAEACATAAQKMFGSGSSRSSGGGGGGSGGTRGEKSSSLKPGRREGAPDAKPRASPPPPSIAPAELLSRLLDAYEAFSGCALVSEHERARSSSASYASELEA